MLDDNLAGKMTMDGASLREADLLNYLHFALVFDAKMSGKGRVTLDATSKPSNLAHLSA